MVPVHVLTKWLKAGQRAHNSRSKFSTKKGNVPYSFYLTWLHKLSLSESSFTPAKAQGADGSPTPHKQNISLSYTSQTQHVIALAPNFVRQKIPPQLCRMLCPLMHLCSVHCYVVSHFTAGHLRLLAAECF